MYTVRSPYMSVQAIRRQLADRGTPTYGKPFYGYRVIVNLPDQNRDTEAAGTCTMDQDSYFVWLSTHFFAATEAIVDQDVGNVYTDAEAFSDPTDKLIQLKMLKSGRRLHSPDFIPLTFFDWEQPVVTTDGTGQSPQSELGFQDSIAIDGTTASLHGWRAFWPEPVLFQPSEVLEIRLRNVNNNSNREGNLFTLCGVKLYPGEVY